MALCTGLRALSLMDEIPGENAARDLFGLAQIPYEQQRYVTCLSLGRSGAVFSEGWERQVTMSGEQAKAIKVRTNTQLIYSPQGSVAQNQNASALPKPVSDAE